MSATLCLKNTTAEMLTVDAPSSWDDAYATAPILAVTPLPSTEDVLHVQFEEALSERLALWQERLDRLSHSSLPLATARNTTKVRFAVPGGLRLWPFRGWQRTIVSACLAMTLMLIGFDLMGLLVLAAR